MLGASLVSKSILKYGLSMWTFYGFHQGKCLTESIFGIGSKISFSSVYFNVGFTSYTTHVSNNSKCEKNTNCRTRPK